MKIFTGASGKPIDRKTAMALAGINLLATPGLGTLLAGRWFAAVGQLAFSVAGFLLVNLWFFELFQSLANGSGGGPAWHWQIGVALFAIGWIASAVTSYNLVQNANTQTPPKLDGTRE